ncbi:MAG: cyclic lactone autoinducer peptide [Ruminococcus sp.]|nr:cyclic lactone autoinducer peptide [Ruminococcus sp.]
MMAAFAMVITTMTANSACIFLTHQPKMPETAKKLRKF